MKKITFEKNKILLSDNKLVPGRRFAQNTWINKVLFDLDQNAGNQKSKSSKPKALNRIFEQPWIPINQNKKSIKDKKQNRLNPHIGPKADHSKGALSTVLSKS